MSDPADNVEAIIRSADELEHFLHRNAGTTADWPVDIIARDKASAEALSEKLNKLSEALKVYRCNPFGIARSDAVRAHCHIRAAQFQEVVEEACVVGWVEFKDSEHPAEILARLVRTEVEMHLDPQVSKAALDLKNTYAGPFRKLWWKIKSWWICRRDNYF